MTDAPIRRVEDCLSEAVHSISREATIADAIKVLRDNHLNALVVNRRDEDDEIGLVAVADIAREVMAKRRPPERTFVFEVMTKPIVSVPAQMRVQYATRLLANLDLSQAVVIDDARRPIGIVNRRDLVFACLED
ncbi:MAG: CBS domain-containing protein [Gammaproteobacteria bacterium]|nr:CBS domain-containing protein [Gammaproteobacteria bacterium]